MKTFSIATIAAVVALTIVPSFAAEYDNENDTIVGRSKTLVEVALRERGVVTSGLEEWGGLIRAWVPNEDGGTSMQFFDADTLQPVSPGRS
ncbi:hypothetical protein [Devosia psychrophila]|uniref:Peptidase propeptide and YPEB domain-containing protein n=1 Tax=Devosia psychrophila TaxID=728005 RepID=A0A0F5PZF9_9HYPH|nr:hypothetical protein [Devosia psychrophila]KKC34028.1 hypothetical protein WH91_05210 [Devosia psychrophila]SFD23227.1 hypothetical protein SAMN04488059_1313 [Devosia psychrophila]